MILLRLLLLLALLLAGLPLEGQAQPQVIGGGGGVTPDGADCNATNKFVTKISPTGVTTCTSPTLAGAQFANQGTATQVLHGNAAGNPLWAQIVNADIANATIDLATKVTGINPTANGGTGSAFFAVAGPTVARVYTFPDAAATVLTTNALVTAAQGGTGVNSGGSSGIVSINVGAWNATTVAATRVVFGAAGNIVTSDAAIITPAAGVLQATRFYAGAAPVTGLDNSLFSAARTFAQLTAADNGTLVYCSDCNATCAAGASTGKWCARTNGAWVGGF